MPELIPMRWPAAWTDASKLELLKGTPINCLAGDTPPPFPLGNLQFVNLAANNAPAEIAVREGVWPGVRGARVDSNHGAVRLASLLEPGKTIWLTHQPPGDDGASPESHVKPVVEAEALGAHWVIALNRGFTEALEARAGRALAAWKRIGSALNLFEGRREWRDWNPVARLAVVSSFKGETRSLGEQFLDLAPRSFLACRPFLPDEFFSAPRNDFEAVLYLESEAPAGEAAQRLENFAGAGGLLIAPYGTAAPPEGAAQARHRVAPLGKGRVATPLEKWKDAAALVDDVHVLMSHRGDAVRLWNATDTAVHHLADPVTSRTVAQLVVYGARTQTVTMGLQRACRTARVFTLDFERASRTTKAGLGYELHVGELTDYAAVLLEG